MSILLIIANARLAWRPLKPKDKAQPSGTKSQHRVILVTASAAIVTALTQGSDWCARFFSPPPTVTVFLKNQASDAVPHCYLRGVGVYVPANVTIKNFEMVMIFPNPIYGSVLEELNETRGRFEVDSPCEIKARSSDPDKRLTITVSSNKREILIRGHDFTQFDAQQIVLAFYPAGLSADLLAELDYRGDATYSAFGRDLQARIHVKPE